MSASRADLEKMVQQNLEAKQSKSKKDPPAGWTAVSDRSRSPNSRDPPEELGTRQTQRMLPPKPAPGMLNQEMAEAAAKKYQKNQKNIQKACAELDGTEPKPTGCRCIIL